MLMLQPLTLLRFRRKLSAGCFLSRSPFANKVKRKKLEDVPWLPVSRTDLWCSDGEKDGSRGVADCDERLQMNGRAGRCSRTRRGCQQVGPAGGERNKAALSPFAAICCLLAFSLSAYSEARSPNSNTQGIASQGSHSAQYFLYWPPLFLPVLHSFARFFMILFSVLSQLKDSHTLASLVKLGTDYVGVGAR
jgi:hypothetical protein